MRKVVDEEVFAEAVGAGVEGAAFVDAGHIVDEAAQNGAVVEHKRVDRDPLVNGWVVVGVEPESGV